MGNERIYNRKKEIRSYVMLLIVAMIWGYAFVVQKTSIGVMGPYTINGIRSFIAALALIPVGMFFDKSKYPNKEYSVWTAEKRKEENRNLIKAGIASGLSLFIATTLQVVGLVYTTPSKSAFITALYMIMVPILGIFVGRKPTKIVYACVLVSAVGLYLLCIPKGDNGFAQINLGDILTFGCAIFFGVQILVIDRYAQNVDCTKLSFFQFLVTGILSIPFMFIFEPDWLSTLSDGIGLLLYLGVLSSGVGFTTQTYAQKYSDPTIAAMIMSLESVFGVISCAIFLNILLSGRELIGCTLMFIAILASQLVDTLKTKKKKEA